MRRLWCVLSRRHGRKPVVAQKLAWEDPYDVVCGRCGQVTIIVADVVR
jgi:hypothetical protein